MDQEEGFYFEGISKLEQCWRKCIKTDFILRNNGTISDLGHTQSTGAKNFVVHQSLRLRMSYCDHLPSVVVRPSSTPLNNFSETLGPVFFKLHVEPSVKGGLKIYTNGHSPLIKMTTMPVYATNT